MSRASWNFAPPTTALVRLREPRYDLGTRQVVLDTHFGVLVDQGLRTTDGAVLLRDNGAFERWSATAFADQRVDLVAAIGHGPVRMPIPVFVSEDARFRTEHRWWARTGRWLIRDRGLYDFDRPGLPALSAEARGASESEAVAVIGAHFQTTLPVLGVEWVPVSIYQRSGAARKRWVRYSAIHATEALVRHGFKRPG